MKRNAEKVIVKWSKKDNDWLSKYPEWENRKGKIMGIAFFNMIRKFEDFLKRDFEGKPTGFVNLRDYLSKGGFDPDSFTISVNAKTIGTEPKGE